MGDNDFNHEEWIERTAELQELAEQCDSGLQERLQERLQLHWAARRGDEAAILRELNSGHDVNATDSEGLTPLMYATKGEASRPSTLKLLLEHGADVHAVCAAMGNQALLMTSDLEKVQCLLGAGADPCFTTSSGYTALTNIPASRDKDLLETMRTLLAAGTDPDRISVYGESAMRVALWRGNIDAVRILLDHDASRTPAQMTDLMWAIVVEDLDEVQAELLKGPDLKAKNYWEMTAFLVGAVCGGTSKMECLLDHGATPGDLGRCGETSLGHAVRSDQVSTLTWLLEQGADLNGTNSFGRSALHSAAEMGAPRCAEALLSSGCSLADHDGSPMITDAASIETVQVFLRHGADINAVGSDGYWPLKTAVEREDLQFTRALLDLGADPNTTDTGETALHVAATWDHVEIAELLLERGADPDAQDLDGETPAMWVRSHECLDILIAAGAKRPTS